MSWLDPCEYPDEEYEQHYGQYYGREYRPPPVRCKYCGSAAVRWRQQGSRWVLFSLTAGVEHNCRRTTAQEDFKDCT